MLCTEYTRVQILPLIRGLMQWIVIIFALTITRRWSNFLLGRLGLKELLLALKWSQDALPECAKTDDKMGSSQRRRETPEGGAMSKRYRFYRQKQEIWTESFKKCPKEQKLVQPYQLNTSANKKNIDLCQIPAEPNSLVKAQKTSLLPFITRKLIITQKKWNQYNNSKSKST